MAPTSSVKVSRLPNDIKTDELAKLFALPSSLIHVRQSPTGASPYAWVNGFSSPAAADRFVERWNDYRIRSAHIVCVVSQATQGARASSISVIQRKRDPSTAAARCPNRIQPARDRSPSPDGYRAPTRQRASADEDGRGEFDRSRRSTTDDGSGGRYSRSPHDPSKKMDPCSEGDRCEVFLCRNQHPATRKRTCLNGKSCDNNVCLYLHPPDRKVCSLGVECKELHCSSNHPPGRSIKCLQGIDCGNYYCTYLHPDGWDPCKDGSKCNNPSCAHTSHLSSRVNQEPQRTTTTVGSYLRSKNGLKSLRQREMDRARDPLPIRSVKDEFCRQLKAEKILLIRAETGSGKSTQLPQYAAEYFQGLVICTQPRVLAAMSLAHRVAQEYDGSSVGHSVGYHVGKNGAYKDKNRVPGTDILFMTEAVLIHEIERNPNLSDVKVLMIDEAHERSVNTDLVLGLAKLLLRARPSDFHVVIASATINSEEFMRFFELKKTQLLDVPGRGFNITQENTPPASDSDPNHVVSVLLQSYPQHQGHTLVFLPGQREIQICMAKFSERIPDDCVAFPLFGALSAEEQDRVFQFDRDPSEKRRMVIFSTNIAETSITIKNLRLVIDAGRVKVARFDSSRRLNMIESVFICKSSADQRKGRAGRTAKGHCIRLYDDEDLVQANIEPEILRSPLDLVVLQLACLELDLAQFPFMTRPNEDDWKRSSQFLKDISCIDYQNKATERGKLFMQLGVDPRLSLFMVNSYLEHQPILELTASIVAILTAPGMLFVLGGETKADKEAARGRVALRAQDYRSDLIYYTAIYNEWKMQGTIDPATSTCTSCQKRVLREYSCLECRAGHSLNNALDNRILHYIESLSSGFVEIMTNPRWNVDSQQLSTANEETIIGKHLLQNFPEQHGYLLVPRSPNSGVRIDRSEIRARISGTSVFAQRRIGEEHFVAMSITRLAENEYVVDRLHPVESPSDDQRKTKLEQYGTIPHVGWELNVETKKKMGTLEGLNSKWAVYEFDQTQSKLTVWGEPRAKIPFWNNFTSVVSNTRKELQARTRHFVYGTTWASFQGGLRCVNVESIQADSNSKTRVYLQQVPCKSLSELYKWLKATLQVNDSDMRRHNFRACDPSSLNDADYKAPPFFIILASDDAYARVLPLLNGYRLDTSQAGSMNLTKIPEKETWGRQLLLNINPDLIIFEKDVEVELEESIVRCVQIGKRLLPGLKLLKLRAETTRENIQEILGEDLKPVNVYLAYPPRNNLQESRITASIYFEDREICRQAMSHLQRYYFRRQSPTQVEELETAPKQFLITAKSRQAALDIYHKPCPSWHVDSSASVTVTHVELYPQMEPLLSYVCDKFTVQQTAIPLPKRQGDDHEAVRYVFQGASPPTVALAASLLRQLTSPIVVKLLDNRQKYLFNELFDDDLIQNWATELGLVCQRKDVYRTVVEVYGPQIEQGQLMRRIADYSEGFDKRFFVYDLEPEIINYFGRQRAADTQLQDMNRELSTEGCLVQLDRQLSCIIIYGKPSVSKEAFDSCKTKLKRLLDKLVTDDNGDGGNLDNLDFSRRCGFCRQQMLATRTFRICGHAYCRCATSAMTKLPLQCPDCNSEIHIQDIQEMFDKDRSALNRLCKESIQTYFSSSSNANEHEQMFCPNDPCDGIIIRKRGYQTCLMCGQFVCGVCEVVNDDLHENRTCVERKARHGTMTDFLPRLFQTAEEFVRSHWTPDLSPIIRVDQNPCLAKTDSVSLKLFFEGVRTIGQTPPPDLEKGFFAFHGTRLDAIEPICHHGFDPARRRAQRRGRGEYFGVTAAISDGYSKVDNASSEVKRMIIAFILKSNLVKTSPEVCYIVDNPTDNSFALNVAVLIVTYGKGATALDPLPFIAHAISIKPPSPPKPDIQWTSPVRWYWGQSKNDFKPYTDECNELLEQSYEKWKRGDGSSKIDTPPLTRYVDDLPQVYEIDFEKNVQLNKKTNYVRRIERRILEDSIISSARHWLYLSLDGTCTPYESMIQGQIEAAYVSYCSGRGPSTIIVQFPGRPEKYELDFVAGKQRNTITSITRPIQRQ